MIELSGYGSAIVAAGTAVFETTLSATGLPSWLTFNPATAEFSGTPGDGDVGSVTVTLTATDGSNAAVSQDIQFTVANVNDAPVGTVSIAGQPVVSETLTAEVALADADGLGSIVYQWNHNGTPIPGEQGSAYTLTLADAGQQLSVTASYTDGYGTAESVTSTPTGSVLTLILGTPGPDSLVGNALDNAIAGLESNDIIQGGGGNDILYGNEGNDKLYGQAGTDQLFGGTGDDAFYINDEADTAYEDIGGGQDQVQTTSDWTLTEGQEIEYAHINTSVGRSLTGNEFANWLDGNIGNDTLRGGGGADYLFGYHGDDTIAGDSGADTLLGGSGADVFTFADGWGQDVILDFENGVDIVDFSGVTGLDLVSQLTITTSTDGGVAAVRIAFGSDFVDIRGMTPTTILDEIVV